MSVWTSQGRKVSDLVINGREAVEDSLSLCHLPLDTRKVILSFLTRSDWVEEAPRSALSEDEVDFAPAAGQSENPSDDEEGKSESYYADRSLTHATIII